MQYVLNTAGYNQMGRRTNQEDAMYPQEPASADRLFMVCDGVGGSVGGELASNAVCKLAPEELLPLTKEGKPLSDSQLRNAMQRVTDRLKDEEIGSAATTMTLLYLSKKGAEIMHTGDSRVYLFRPGKGMVMHTKDHSLVQTFVDEGMMTEEEARVHPQSNIITRCMRIVEDDEEMAEPAIDRIKDLRKGDVFLLCSDGVWGEMTAKELTAAVLNDKPLAERCKNLASLTAESHDNNTAMLVEIADVKKSFWWFG